MRDKAHTGLSYVSQVPAKRNVIKYKKKKMHAFLKPQNLPTPNPEETENLNRPKLDKDPIKTYSSRPIFLVNFYPS